jgi:DNA repair ATPase RecN
MSKLAIVQALNNSSGPQLQIVQSVQALQQAVSSMHESLQDLPVAISAEVTAALERLGTLEQSVKQALEAYDEITELQRQSLDALALEMTSNATQAFQAQVKQLDTTLGDLAQTLSELKINLNGMYQSARQISRLPEALETATEEAKSSAARLTQAANDSRQPLWRQALILMLAALIAAALALAGRSVWETLQLPSKTEQLQLQQDASVARELWNKATPQEREGLNQILKRPKK